MGYAIYKVGPRWGGYGVPCYCEYPSCKKKIDRGMSYACGGEPFSEFGCDRYFCGDHKSLVFFKQNGDEGLCDHDDKEEECNCAMVEVCEMCEAGGSPFPYKPEHPTWIKWILKDKSWAEWREKNPEEVERMKKTLQNK